MSYEGNASRSSRLAVTSLWLLTGVLVRSADQLIGSGAVGS